MTLRNVGMFVKEDPAREPHKS